MAAQSPGLLPCWFQCGNQHLSLPNRQIDSSLLQSIGQANLDHSPGTNAGFGYLGEALALERISSALRMAIGAVALSAGLLGANVAAAQSVVLQPPPQVVGKINWGIWIDDDGCMHWWADGGLEGYMLDRVDPKTGRAICLRKNTCFTENTDTLFATDSAQLTTDGRRRLTAFFQSAGAFGYAIYGHTDSRASDQYNINLSQRRARAVGDVARSVGAVVERQLGYGESRPIASNATAAGMQQNRRVEVVCYMWGKN
jgi:outer membrane protein OmpA-like peptidoglycan-associated protein